MDRRERRGDLLAGLMAFGEDLQSRIWTALPGIIQSFNANKKTCEVLIAIQMQAQLPNGQSAWQTISKLVDVPVFYPSGGGVTLTFPIQSGDECLVVFSSRCIDNWWASSGVQSQAESRMHDLSDGIAFVGISSLPNVPGSINTAAAELRSNDGNAVVRVNPTNHQIDVSTTGNANVNASGNVSVQATGNASVQAGGTLSLTAATINISGTLNINGEAYTAHRHSGVTTGPSNTGGKV